MTKSELIQRLAERNPHLYMRDIEKIVDTFFEQITKALAQDNRVELRGFGAFSVKHRDARTGRNPRTGESVFVEAKRLPFFKTGKGLRERLNDDNQQPQQTETQPTAHHTPAPSDGGGSSSDQGQGGGNNTGGLF